MLTRPMARGRCKGNEAGSRCVAEARQKPEHLRDGEALRPA
jgi:hypothetical protein